MQSRIDRLRALAEDLRSGRKVTDVRFDRVFPLAIRKLSDIHWTPVEVALRAAEWLATDSSTRVLDVGSGCGKFCLVAALTRPGRFTGIEKREEFVEASRNASREIGARRASFLLGDMNDLDWSRFDAFYLFNPFYELKEKSVRIDRKASLSLWRYRRHVEAVKSKLREARTDTRVVTFHGFGGYFPPGYQRLRREPCGENNLELWVKRPISH